MAAARAVVDASGPLSETTPPRAMGTGVLEGMRDVAAAARRARVLLAGMDASTRAIARVALGSGVEVREASAGGALDAARDARPDLVILPSAGAADVVGALRADPLTRESKVLLVGEASAAGRRRAPGHAVLAAPAPGQAAPAAGQRGHRGVIVAVLAGGRSRRMGAPKALVSFGGAPLIHRPLAAARAAGLPAIVVAKPGSPLPELDVPVLDEPEEISHPLAGLIAALEHAPEIVAVACDQPWVTGEAIRVLAARPEPIASLPGQPFPGRYTAAVLPALRDALAREAPLREILADAATVDLRARVSRPA